MELRVTMEENPTYPCVSEFSGISLAMCLDLADRLRHVLTKEQIGYAVAMECISKQKKILKDDYARILSSRYHIGFVDPSIVEPFPRELFVDHPLGHVNPDNVVVKDVILDKSSFGGAGGNPIDLVRERKWMQNRIAVEVTGDGEDGGGGGKKAAATWYKMREGIGGFVGMLRALNRPVS
jgi:hypothetical protein